MRSPRKAWPPLFYFWAVRSGGQYQQGVASRLWAPGGRSTSSQMHYGDYSSTASRSQESRIQYIGPASSFFACLLTAAAALSLFSFGGRAPHPEGTWPKTLLHKPMGVASTEGGGLARRPSSEIDRLAAKGRGIWRSMSIRDRSIRIRIKNGG